MFGPASLTVSQSVSAFNGFLPKLTEIRRADPGDVAFAADVRLGEVASVAVTLGLGVIASSLTGSPVPTVTAGLMCLILVVIYESALRGDRVLEPRGTLKVVPDSA